MEVKLDGVHILVGYAPVEDGKIWYAVLYQLSDDVSKAALQSSFLPAAVLELSEEDVAPGVPS